MEIIKKLIIDEGVGQKSIDLFYSFCKRKKIKFEEELKISDHYVGMPDISILNNLLNKNTCFLTKDRAFHNLILSKKLVSYYITGENIINSFLKEIKIKNITEFKPKNSTKLFNDEFLIETAIHQSLLPKNPKELKKLRTKRRRIRAHFGSYGNIKEIAATISWRNYKNKIVCGLKLHISSNTGIKAFTGTENFFLENVESNLNNFTTIAHVLIVMLNLKLQFVKTIIYFDEPVFSSQSSKKIHEKYENFQKTLINEFKNIKFQPVAKGYHLENLKKKISAIIQNQTNELKEGNLMQMF